MIGAPWAYLLTEFEPPPPAAEREGTIYYPFHTWDHGEIEGDHSGLIDTIRDTEPGPVTVCLYWIEYDIPEVRHAYEEAGFRVICHGRRGWLKSGTDPQFLYNQHAELARHRRVASNRLTSAILYGASMGCEVGVYGDPMAYTDVRAAHAHHIDGNDTARRLFPGMEGVRIDPELARGGPRRARPRPAGHPRGAPRRVRLAAVRMTLEIGYVQGEMAEWSDLGSPQRPAGGEVLHRVVADLVPDGSRVLVVGVHDPALVQAVLDRARSVVLVLRSRVDALAAAEAYADRPVELVCGDGAGVRLEEPADVLLALDGLDRAVSAESPMTPWRDRLAHLRDQLVPGGRVLVTVANPLGPLAGTRGEVRDDDAAWRSVVRPEHRAPGSADALAEAVGDGARWSLWPDLGSPDLALPLGTTAAGSWEAALARVHAGHRDEPLDGPTTVASAAAAGRADEVAAGWLLVTGARAGTICPTAPAAGTAGRVLEEVVLEACAIRETGHLRRLVQGVLATLGSCDEAARSALSPLGPDEVLLADDGRLLPLRLGSGDAAPAEELLAGWCADLGVRLETLGWRHPWPTSSGAHEFARLLAAAAGLPPDLVPSRAAAAAAPGERAEHIARLQAEIDSLRAQVAWFEQAVRQRDHQLATSRHQPGDPRPGLTRKLRETEAELAAVRGSSSFRLGRALTRPVRVIRSRRR